MSDGLDIGVDTPTERRIVIYHYYTEVAHTDQNSTKHTC